MALVRWSPVRDAFLVQNEMNRILDEFLGGRFEGESPAVWQPHVDIEENDNGYIVRTELPGMKLENIKITLTDNQLVIRGEKQRELEQKGATYHRTERAYGQFERAFTLAHPVRPEAIEATYRDGVLEVSVPKAEEAKTREIPIKTSR
jgi:HSP20 family protein